MKARMVLAVAFATAVAVGLSVAPLSASAVPVPSESTLPAPTDAERQLFDWLNQERSTRGLAPLLRTTVLDGFAKTWSDHMAGGGCLAREARRICHRPDLLAVANAAYPNAWLKIGENVGLVPNGGTLESLHQAFMDSPGHQANMLSGSYNAVGLGVAFDAEGTLYVSFEFVAAKGNPAVPADGFGGLPAPPAGASEEDILLFWINDARTKEGLGALTRHAVLDREAESWSALLAAGQACPRGTSLCHRKDMKVVAKTALGARGARWWSENVGQRRPANLVSQFQGFINSPPHRANIMRPNLHFVGIGYVLDEAGDRGFTTLEFVAAKQPSAQVPARSSCGWVPSSIVKGAKGPFVRTLQCALAQAGFYAGPMDGLYTKNVVDAVKAFQKSLGVKRPNGKADLKTRRRLGLV